MVSFGQASGSVPPLDVSTLNQKGSLYVTRPSMAHYIATREELTWRAGEVLGWIAEGKLRLSIDRELPLEKAADAHRARGAGDHGEGVADSVGRGPPIRRSPRSRVRRRAAGPSSPRPSSPDPSLPPSPGEEGVVRGGFLTSTVS
jgi:hypothetical protein